MSTKISDKDHNNPYYLLGFNPDDLDSFSEDEASLAELGSLDGDSDYYPKDIDHTIPNSLGQQNEIQASSSPVYTTKTVQKEKQTLYNVPEVRSAVDGLLLFSDILTSFTCDIVCDQTIFYKVLTNAHYSPFELEKLDIVLNENSVLDIQVNCTLNGLDVLEYTSWITEALNEVCVVYLMYIIGIVYTHCCSSTIGHEKSKICKYHRTHTIRTTNEW